MNPRRMPAPPVDDIIRAAVELAGIASGGGHLMRFAQLGRPHLVICLECERCGASWLTAAPTFNPPPPSFEVPAVSYDLSSFRELGPCQPALPPCPECGKPGCTTIHPGEYVNEFGDIVKVPR